MAPAIHSNPPIRPFASPTNPPTPHLRLSWEWLAPLLTRPHRTLHPHPKLKQLPQSHSPYPTAFASIFKAQTHSPPFGSKKARAPPPTKARTPSPYKTASSGPAPPAPTPTRPKANRAKSFHICSSKMQATVFTWASSSAAAPESPPHRTADSLTGEAGVRPYSK